MPGRRGSNHRMSMTGHREALRRHCACCENYRIVHRFPTQSYYCSTCTKKITSQLKKQKIDLQAVVQNDGLAAINPIIDEIEKAIRATLPPEKTTERDLKQKWRPLKRKKDSQG